MKSTLLIAIFLLFVFNLTAQISICSWNLKDFGKSKSDDEVEFVANTIKYYDVIAIQEVVAGYGGSQAVAKLASVLNQKGAKWDYVVSNPTSSNNSYKIERYAFIWKTATINKVGDAWLEKQYNLEIDREPFFATFSSNNKLFTLVNFHAITKAKQPETEIKYFKFLPEEYPDLNLIFAGDFNCPQSHTVFNPLKKMGYQPILNNQKTSLKMQCLLQDCLASEFDNIFYCTQKCRFIDAGIIPFYTNFIDLKAARNISDHVPIFFSFSLN